MALFGNGYGAGLLGGATAPDNKWLQALSILGATLQDYGAAENGRQGYALPLAMQGVQRLKDQKAYQSTLDDLSKAPSTSLTPPVLEFPQAQPGAVGPAPGSLQIKDPGSINAVPGGPLFGAQFANMLPLLKGLDPDKGLPLAFDAIQEASKPKAPIKLGQNERLLDPNDPTKVLVGPAPEQRDPNKPFYMGANGEVLPNPDYQAYTLRNARAAATNISLNTEKSYAGTVATELARADAAALDAAKSAPQRIQSAQNVLRILDTQTPITGTGANARLALDKALSTAGLVDGKNVVSTENLASELASQTLDAIKSSGLGSGQGFTDKDRQFLEKARAGNIEINAGTLHYLARKNEEAARAALRRGNSIAKRLKGDKNFGSVGQDLEIPEPPPYSKDQPKASGRFTIESVQ